MGRSTRPIVRTVIVIPAYNEAATLRDVAVRALAQCAQVFVVDDGSTDDTAACLDGLPVMLIRHPTNQGKAASLWDGFVAALARRAELVVTLDADGQHQPEDVPRLVAAAQLHPHRLVIGARLRHRDGAPAVRRIANGVADFWVSWTAGHPVADSQSGQRAYPAALLQALLHDDGLRHDQRASFTLESEILIAAARLGYETVAVPIDTLYFGRGRASYFRPVRDVVGIGSMVARHLVATRMNPCGLWRTLSGRPMILRSDPEPLHGAPPARVTAIAETITHTHG
jgi:glycosyltransferase involved in cell wall biosynthesis